MPEPLNAPIDPSSERLTTFFEETFEEACEPEPPAIFMSRQAAEELGREQRLEELEQRLEELEQRLEEPRPTLLAVPTSEEVRIYSRKPEAFSDG